MIRNNAENFVDIPIQLLKLFTIWHCVWAQTRRKTDWSDRKTRPTLPGSGEDGRQQNRF